MGQSRRVRRYAEKHFTEIQHTTLNPEGPGVVRIHLLPPEISGNVIGASVAILNGRFIVPVNVGWTIVLTELISRINTFSGREVTEDEVATVIDETCILYDYIYVSAGVRGLQFKIDPQALVAFVGAETVDLIAEKTV